MRLKAFLITPLAALSLNAHCQIENKLLFDTNHWKRFNWDRAEASELWNSSSFINYDTDSAKYTTTKSLITNINGIDFKISTAKYKNKKNNEDLLIASVPSAEFSECERQHENAKKSFGKPTQLVDNSYTITDMLRINKFEHQWINSNTTITLSCIQFRANNTQSKDGVVYYFEKTTKESKIQHPFSLLCERKIKLPQQKDWEEAPQMMFTVLPAEGIVADLDRNAWSKLDAISDTEIKFTIDQEHSNTNYKINRVSGTLSGIMNLKVDAAAKSYLAGKCKKIDNAERKF